MSTITRSEAQFKGRNVIAMLNRFMSAAKEGDWKNAFDYIYDAHDALGRLVPHIEEAADQLANKRDREAAVAEIEVEPVGSLKYYNRDGSIKDDAPAEQEPPRKKRTGGMGYRGSHHGEPNSDYTNARSRGSHYTDYRQTNLAPPPIIPLVTPPPAPAPAVITPPPPPKVGDWVQWESGGVLQMPEAAQIDHFSDDGEWAFFAHSATGVPVSQLIPAAPSPSEPGA